MDDHLVQGIGRTLIQTERLSATEIEEYRAPLLAKLLVHAKQTTEFYKDRLQFDVGSSKAIQRIWSKIPILTRAEAVSNCEKLQSSANPPEGGRVIGGRTSGSTGTPLAFKRSVSSVIAAQALTERMFRWWSIDGKKSLAQISEDRSNLAPPPDGRTTYGWHSSSPNGPRYFLSVAADFETQFAWVSARKPDYLGSYAPILRELAVATRKRGAALKFGNLLSFSTVVDADTRELCRSAFGAEIADTYGAQETGHIAAQCPDCGEYHISAETILVEVLRDDGSTASPGETGRVVVTPLYSYAMPLVRYELGDLAEVGSAVPSCNRGLPALRRILGRDRNFFRFRDGTKLYPNVASFQLDRFAAVKQWQIVQTDFDHIEIRYVPELPGENINAGCLAERVSAVLRQPVNVVLRAVEKIERSPSGKYEDCISLISST
jgi:phenylacetate-CoA ligase